MKCCKTYHEYKHPFRASWCEGWSFELKCCRDMALVILIGAAPIGLLGNGGLSTLLWCVPGLFVWAFGVMLVRRSALHGHRKAYRDDYLSWHKRRRELWDEDYYPKPNDK